MHKYIGFDIALLLSECKVVKMGLCTVMVLLGIIGATDSVVRLDVLTVIKENAIIGNELRNDQVDIAPLLGLQDGIELKRVAEHLQDDGSNLVYFQEMYQGISVISEGIILETNRQNVITGAKGGLVDKLAEDLNGLLNHNQKSNAQNKFSENGHQPASSVNSIILMIKVFGQQARYVSVVPNQVTHGEQQTYSVSDAVTGESVYPSLSMSDLNKIQVMQYFQAVGGNLKTGPHIYDGKLFDIFVKVDDDGFCVMENDFIRGVHEQEAFPFYPSYKYNCTTGPRDEANGGYSPLADAFYFTSIIYSMYTTWYGINPYLTDIQIEESDRNYSVPKIISIHAHFGSELEQGMWEESRMAMAIGDGKDVVFPLSTLNVMAHEISHHVTTVTSGLNYFGQSGGINEAFSDMSSETAESFLVVTPDWLMAADLFKEEGVVLRYFDYPEKDNYSISHADDYCPGLDVHLSSGVFNKAFYLLSNKWSVKKAFEVFLLANIRYWTKNSDYNSAACGVMKAAKDRQYSRDDVRAVFLEVGVLPCEESTTFPKNTFALAPGEERTVNYHLSSDTSVIFCPGGSSVSIAVKQHSHIVFATESDNTWICNRIAITGQPTVTDITFRANEELEFSLLFFYPNQNVVTVFDEIVVGPGQPPIDVHFYVDASKLDNIKRYALLVIIDHDSPLGQVLLTPRRGYKSELLDSYFAKEMRSSESQLLLYACLIKPGVHYLEISFADVNKINRISKVSYVFIELFPEYK